MKIWCAIKATLTAIAMMALVARPEESQPAPQQSQPAKPDENSSADQPQPTASP